MKYLMQGVSFVFHPLLMATYSCLILSVIFPAVFMPIPIKGIPFFIGAVFVITFLMPAVSIFFMKLMKTISSFELHDRKERLFPFMSISAFYGVGTYMFYTKVNLSMALIYIMAIATILIVMLFVISFWYKISIHAAAIWGVAGIMSVVSMRYLDVAAIPVLMAIFLLSGLTATSRLYLGRHTPAEVWSGAILAFAFCSSATFILV